MGKVRIEKANINPNQPTTNNQALDVSKMSDAEYLQAIDTPKSQRLRQGNFGPIATPSGSGSKYDLSFAASPYLNPEQNMMALQRNRATMQPWTEQALSGLAQIPVSVVTGLGETAGYLFDWAEITGVQRDYGNWLSNTMKDWKKSFQDEVAPIYRKNPDDPYDLSDSGMYFQTASDLISSITQFAIAGAGIGGALGKTAGALAEGFQVANSTAKALKGGAQLLTNLGLTYTESMMNASDVYKQSQQMALQNGYSEDQANTLAGEAASKALKIGMANIAFNHTGLKPIFRRMNVLSVAEREAAERVGKMAATNVLEDEVLSKALSYATRLGEAPGTIVSKMNTIRHALKEAGQEYLEETVGAVSQNEGTYYTKQKLGLVQSSSFGSRLGELLISEEGIAQGLLGAVGGAGSGIVMQGAMGRGAARQADVRFAQHIETLKQNKESIDTLFKGAKQQSIINNITNEALKGDEAAYKSAKNDMLRELFKDNHKAGLTEGLIRQLEAVGKSSKEDAVALGFIQDTDTTGDLVTEANESVKNVKEWSKIYDNINNNYPIASKYVMSTTNAKGEQDVQLVSDIIFDAAVRTKQAEAQYKQEFGEANRIKGEYTANSKLSNQANEVAAMTVDREVTQTFVDGFLKPRLAELISGQTETNAPLVRAYMDLIKGNEQKIASINEQIKGIEEVAKDTNTIDQLKSDLRIAHTNDLDQYAEQISKALTADYVATREASAYNHLTSKEFLNNLDKKSTESQVKQQVQQAEREAVTTKQATQTQQAARTEQVAQVQENPFAGVNTGVEENIVTTEEVTTEEPPLVETVEEEVIPEQQPEEETKEEQTGDLVQYVTDEGIVKQGTIVNRNENAGLLTIKDTDGNFDLVGVFQVEMNTGPVELEAQTPPEEENDAPLNNGVIITSDPIVTFEATTDKSPEPAKAGIQVNAFKGAEGTRKWEGGKYRKRTAEEQALWEKHNGVTENQYRDEQITIGDTIHYEFTFGGEHYNNEKVLSGELTPRIDMVNYDASNTRRIVDKAASPYGADGKTPNKKANVDKLLHLYEDMMTQVKASPEYQAWLKDKSQTFTVKFPVTTKVTGKYFGYIETTDNLNNLNEVYGALNKPFPVILGTVNVINGVPKLEFNNLDSFDINPSDLVYNTNELQPGRIYSIIPGCNGKYTVSRCFTRHVVESEVQEVFDLIAKAEVANLNGKGGIREKINSLVPVYFGKDATSKKLQFNVVTNEGKNGVDIWVGQKKVSKAQFLQTLQDPAMRQKVVDWFTKNQYRQVDKNILNEMNNNEKYTTGTDPIVTANLPTNGKIVTDGNIEVTSYERPAQPIAAPKVETKIEPVVEAKPAKKQYTRPSAKPLSTTEIVTDNTVGDKEADAIVDKSKDISKDDVDNTKKYCK